MSLDRDFLMNLQTRLENIREAGEDYLIVSVGVRGPNVDCPRGNAVATVRMGRDEGTAQAKYLPDALAMARTNILRDRQARQKKDDQAQ